MLKFKKAIEMYFNFIYNIERYHEKIRSYRVWSFKSSGIPLF